MEAPGNGLLRVLILGHSFIRRLREFISTHSDDFPVDFRLAVSEVTRWHGVGARTVAKTLQFDLAVVSSFRPDIVILQLGSNDLVTFPPLHVGSIIEDFVRLLHTSYGVKLVCVSQTLRRDNAIVFNSKVGLLTRCLRVVLEPLPYAIFWGHRGFWKARSDFYAPDGVHLNEIGRYELYKSLRGAVLHSLRLFQCPPN